MLLNLLTAAALAVASPHPAALPAVAGQLPAALPAVVSTLPAIADGKDAAAGAYPFAVLLTMTGLPADDGGTRDSSCSGALIAPRWVITAGHCFRTAEGKHVSRLVAARTTATIGRADLTGRAGHEVEVVGVRQADGPDVALAELATAITDIVPLRIGTRPPQQGDVLRLTGYGLTGGDESATTRRLQTGQFLVETVGDTLLETSGRAPDRETSPCKHDSGGPYFTEPPDGGPVLVAVVSTGPGCPHTGADFSARTDNLAGWITDEITDPGRRVPWAWIAVAAALSLAILLATVAFRRRGTRGRRRRHRFAAGGAGRPAAGVPRGGPWWHGRG